jgi:hypothetical protein
MVPLTAMRRAFVSVIACVLACAASTKRSQPPADNVSAEEANPYPIELQERSTTSASAIVEAHAPTAGTWWYVVAAPRRAGFSEGDLEFVTSYDSGPAGKITVADFTPGFNRLPINKGWVTELAWPVGPGAPDRYTIAVSTMAATRFEVRVTYRWRSEVPIDAPMPQDADETPTPRARCADLNAPDFRNRACCEARCSFGAMRCDSKIISGGPRVAKIRLSAKDEIMAGAKGNLYMNMSFVSEIIVSRVDENDSTIGILQPERVDMGRLLDEGRVVLSLPPECQRFYPRP